MIVKVRNSGKLQILKMKPLDTELLNKENKQIKEYQNMKTISFCQQCKSNFLEKSCSAKVSLHMYTKKLVSESQYS